MSRRKETRTITKTTEVRVEFTPAELCKRLRLPANAKLFVGDASTDMSGPYVELTSATDGYPLVATWTTSSTDGPGKGNA